MLRSAAITWLLVGACAPAPAHTRAPAVVAAANSGPVAVTGPRPLAALADDDVDADGFANSDDACPRAAGVEPDGCPIPDGDYDGILDQDDRCPAVPERRNHYLDEDGCPDEVPPDLVEFPGSVAGLRFEPGSSDILIRDAERTLVRVAAALQRHPVRLQITGYLEADERVEYSRDPSLRRAGVVKDFLVAHGVDARRLEAYGADRPENPDERIHFVLLLP